MHYTNAAHFCADDRFILLSSCSFADSVRTIYSALLNGAALYPFALPEEGTTRLANWLRQHEITIYRSVPTAFRHFASTLTGERNFPALRLIYLAGEPVYKRDVALYRKYFAPDCILVNRMGTGEALTCRAYFIDQHTPISGNNVPIGYAIPDKEILLLDEADQLVDGVGSGEIAVKSHYLSPGYWRRPELTQAVFLADPAGGNARIYRTGDLGRRLADGCLLHLGRKDFQIKVRGHRVEAAEVEMVLLHHTDIKDALVTACEDGYGDMRLVAYLLPMHHALPTVTALRQFLADKLPNYMIPSAFVTLDAIPITSSGKVDRRSLPSPEGLRPRLDVPYTAPRNPIEKMLVQLWGKVLELGKVGIHDPFLELGGNSLLATQIITRVIEAFRVNLSVYALIEASTVAAMANIIVAHEPAPGEAEKIALALQKVVGMSDAEVREALNRRG
jgi:acyl-coenzyme A synthetase/AMP-(fatty) acid ligase